MRFKFQTLFVVELNHTRHCRGEASSHEDAQKQATSSNCLRSHVRIYQNSILFSQTYRRRKFTMDNVRWHKN